MSDATRPSGDQKRLTVSFEDSTCRVHLLLLCRFLPHTSLLGTGANLEKREGKKKKRRIVVGFTQPPRTWGRPQPDPTGLGRSGGTCDVHTRLALFFSGLLDDWGALGRVAMPASLIPWQFKYCGRFSIPRNSIFLLCFLPLPPSCWSGPRTCCSRKGLISHRYSGGMDGQSPQVTRRN